MISPTDAFGQDKCTTIDALADGVALLSRRMDGLETITARELRALWHGRLRPFWRLHLPLYRTLSRRLLEHGDNYLASEVADEGAEFFGDDVSLILTHVLAMARSGAQRTAQELLTRKEEILANVVEARSLLARTFKDLWKSSGEERYLRQSFDLYYLDYMTTTGDRSFPGVNAASTALFLGRPAEAKRIAGEVVGILREKEGYWNRVSIAECLLVDGRIESARTAYAEAAGRGGIPFAHLATTRGQARLLLTHLGRNGNELDECFPLPSVIAFTGHRIDTPTRATPRFPEALAPAIKKQIRESVLKAKAGFGYAAAANGADILFLEVMQEQGLETYVYLPLPEEEFIRECVVQPGAPGWLERYRNVTANATEFTFATDPGPLRFDYGNRLQLGAAFLHARQFDSDLRLLAVWDGRPGEGAGGTADYIALAREAGQTVEVIDVDRNDSPVALPLASPGTDSGERLLAMLTLSLPPDEQVETRLAALVKERDFVHLEVAGARARIFFRTPTEAAQATEIIARELGPRLIGALGLHAGPVRIGTHPLTGERVIRGAHAEKSDELSTLEPPGVIYTSFAFAALLALASCGGARCEFLGYRELQNGAPREQIFRLVA